MTPESLVAAFALFDRWRLALAQLHGEPLTVPPPLPVRRFVAPAAPTPEDDARERDAEIAAAQAWQALAGDSEGGSID